MRAHASDIRPDLDSVLYLCRARLRSFVDVIQCLASRVIFSEIGGHESIQHDAPLTSIIGQHLRPNQWQAMLPQISSQSLAAAGIHLIVLSKSANRPQWKTGYDDPRDEVR